MKKLKLWVTINLLIATGICSKVYAQNVKLNYRSLHSQSYVQDKNFYLFTLFEQLPGIHSVFAQNTVIRTILNKKFKELKQLSACKEDVQCTAAVFLWSPSDITIIGDEFKNLGNANQLFKKLVNDHLRPSGRYIIYSSLNDGALLQSAWIDAANGINHIINTYALGLKPTYPDIDSASYNVRSKTYARLMAIIYLQTIENLNGEAFYQPSLDFGLSLLEVNNRNEAGRFEPLQHTENSALLNYIKQIKWAKYPYTFLLVPGAGNDPPNISLAAWGKMRLKIAIERYKKGLAPIIAVSGGYVHPFQTPYCEAVEMKKYLMSFYHIPAKAILVDPYARHTTTNIRNVNRLVYEYGIPANKKGLIVTDQNQSSYIADKKFEARCRKELKGIPYKSLKRISIYDLAFIPDSSSLYYNSIDPLDP